MSEANEANEENKDSTETGEAVLLGQGTFGEVYLQHGYAYKVCALLHTKESSTGKTHVLVDNVIREAVFYSCLKSASDDTLTSKMFQNPPPCIPQAEVMCRDHHVALKMKNLGTTLYGLRQQSKAVTGRLFGELLLGLVWLHTRGWTHGDIKPANLLLSPAAQPSLVAPQPLETPQASLTLIDYGSMMFSSFFTLEYQRCTLYYVSPEELLKHQSSPKTDMWSFGAVLFEYVTGHYFIVELMKFLKINADTINAFCDHVNDEELREFNSKQYLIQLYSGLLYSQIVGMLYKVIKDRAVLSVLCHCMMMDPHIRTTATRLLAYEGLFSNFKERYQQYVWDWKSFHNTISTYDGELELSYAVSTASVASQERMLLVYKICSIFDQLEQDDLLTYPTLMLFDRFSFRRQQAHHTLDQSPDIHKAAYLMFSVFITLMLHKGYTLSLEELQRFFDEPIAAYKLMGLLEQFIRVMDFKLFGCDPCSAYALQQSLTDHERTGLVSKMHKLQYKWLEVCTQHPLIHNELPGVYKKMWGGE